MLNCRIEEDLDQFLNENGLIQHKEKFTDAISRFSGSDATTLNLIMMLLRDLSKFMGYQGLILDIDNLKQSLYAESENRKFKWGIDINLEEYGIDINENQNIFSGSKFVDTGVNMKGLLAAASSVAAVTVYGGQMAAQNAGGVIETVANTHRVLDEATNFLSNLEKEKEDPKWYNAVVSDSTIKAIKDPVNLVKGGIAGGAAGGVAVKVGGAVAAGTVGTLSAPAIAGAAVSYAVAGVLISSGFMGMAHALPLALDWYMDGKFESDPRKYQDYLEKTTTERKRQMDLKYPDYGLPILQGFSNSTLYDASFAENMRMLEMGEEGAMRDKVNFAILFATSKFTIKQMIEEGIETFSVNDVINEVDRLFTTLFELLDKIDNTYSEITDLIREEVLTRRFDLNDQIRDKISVLKRNVLDGNKLYTDEFESLMEIIYYVRVQGKEVEKNEEEMKSFYRVYFEVTEDMNYNDRAVYKSSKNPDDLSLGYSDEFVRTFMKALDETESFIEDAFDNKDSPDYLELKKVELSKKLKRALKYKTKKINGVYLDLTKDFNDLEAMLNIIADLISTPRVSNFKFKGRTKLQLDENIVGGGITQRAVLYFMERLIPRMEENIRKLTLGYDARKLKSVKELSNNNFDEIAQYSTSEALNGKYVQILNSLMYKILEQKNLQEIDLKSFLAEIEEVKSSLSIYEDEARQVLENDNVSKVMFALKRGIGHIVGVFDSLTKIEIVNTVLSMLTIVLITRGVYTTFNIATGNYDISEINALSSLLKELKAVVFKTKQDQEDETDQLDKYSNILEKKRLQKSPSPQQQQQVAPRTQERRPQQRRRQRRPQEQVESYEKEEEEEEQEQEYKKKKSKPRGYYGVPSNYETPKLPKGVKIKVKREPKWDSGKYGSEPPPPVLDREWDEEEYGEAPGPLQLKQNRRASQRQRQGDKPVFGAGRKRIGG